MTERHHYGIFPIFVFIREKTSVYRSETCLVDSRVSCVIVGFANVYDVTGQPPSPHALSLTDLPLPPPDEFATTAVN